MSTTTTYTLDVSIGEPLSENDRLHWAAKARRVKQWRTAGMYAAKELRTPPLERIRVQLVMAPPTKHRRDEANYWPTQKALIDGLRDAGVVPDDDRRYVEELTPRLIEPQEKRWRLYLHITPIE